MARTVTRRAYAEYRRTGLGLSVALHTAVFGILVVLGRNPAHPAPLVPQHIAYLVDLPSTREPAAAARPVPERVTSATERIRSRVSPSLSRPSAPVIPPQPRRPAFNEESYRRSLEQQLARIPAPPADLTTGRTVTPNESFSASDYRARLEERLKGSTAPSRPSTKSPALPPVPDLTQRRVPAVEIPLSSGSFVGIQFGAAIPAWYVEAIRRRIEQNWKYGQRTNLLSERALVSFSIARSGLVSGVFLEDRSRTAAFNQSVLDAVKRSSPLPGLPPEVKEDVLDVTIEFSARGVR